LDGKKNKTKKNEKDFLVGPSRVLLIELAFLLIQRVDHEIRPQQKLFTAGDLAPTVLHALLLGLVVGREFLIFR
jgi:hypothetical protein